MSTRRALTTAVCPCGVSEEDCGRLWVNHTATCVAWIAKRRRLLDPATPIPHAGELVSAAEIDHSQISLPDTPPGISIEAPPQEEHGDDARTVSEPNQQPMVISKDGLRMVIRLPPSLRLPLQAVNMPPSGPSPMDTSAVNQDISSDSNRSLIWQSSQPNRFGLVRKYLQVQGHTPMIPDFNLPTAYFSRSIVNDTTAASFDKSRTLLDIIYPFPNTSTFRLAHWFITGSNAKSQDERTRLISDVILAPGFSPEHFKGVNLRTMDKLIDALDSVVVDDQSNLPPHATGDGWRSHELKISVPRASRAGARARTQAAIFSESFDEFGEVIDIPGLRTRSLVNVIRTHFSLPSSESVGPLHYLPYQHYWQHGTDSLERIYDELYTGNAWLQEHERLQNSPPVPGCQLERAIVAMMFSSDATHIGQFGQSYLWPIYLYFGNNSKWDRRRLSSRICEHIAYIPKMPDEVKSQLQMLQSGRLQPALLAHCKREIFHNCWRILIDDDFIDAYGHGMVVKCSDGVERRLYPRVFTYSADYPEKVLIATIKDFGIHPCPRCLVTKPELSQLGLPNDISIRTSFRKDDNEQQSKVLDARRLIYHDGYVVNSTLVENILSNTSSTPTINAFSTRLNSNPMFNLHRMLVPDLLHEVELGVWKSLFAHLIRMLHTCGPHAVAIFDSRFREIISYPPDTIRKFRHSVSGMKKLAGRDYEDILQCCGPCFEGLFPDEDDAAIQQLIFTMAHWHALAKLRVHTATTLTLLRNQTATLGRRLRRFQSAVAARYNTVETDNEHEKRKRQETRRALATGSVLHSHGDYADAIELYGTADSYSTQIGELEHRRAKSHARRASQAQLVEGVNKVDRRQNYLNQCAEKLAKFEDQELVEQEAQRAEPETESAEPGSSQESTQYESLDAGGISEHHHVGIRGVTVQLGSFLRQNANDRALLNFIPSLKDHLLLRFGVSPAENLLFTELQRQQVVIPSGTLTKHATLRVSYTTYDVRRNQDTINPRTKHHFVMVQSRDNDPDHPFWYAKVLGIYHANVVHLALQSQIPRRIDFLWVRWLELTHIGSWDLCQLDRVAYATPNSTIDEFGFIDPTTVVRSSHLIPAFCYNRATDPVLPSLAYDSPLSGDWNSYYVNRFVDRDMSIRYMPGIGIGHLSSMQHPRESAIEPMDVDEPELEIGPAREEMATTSGSDAEHDGSDNSSVASVDEFCEEDEDY